MLETHTDAKQVTDIVDFIPQKLSQLPRVVNGRLAAAKAAKTHNIVDNYLYVNTGWPICALSLGTS